MQRQTAATAAFICASLMMFSPVLAGAATASDQILMSTNEQSYTAGELVNIKGQIAPPVTAGQLLVIRIFTPDGQFYRQSELDVDRDGLFSWSFLPSGEVGTWKIDARFSTKEAETTFTIADQDLFDRVVMASPKLIDIQGHEMMSGRAGDNIMITTNLANDEPDAQQPYVFIVQITNEKGMVELVSLALGSLGPGQSANPSVAWLPETPGTYTADVFAWSSLGSPTPLVEKQSVTFKVE